MKAGVKRITEQRRSLMYRMSVLWLLLCVFVFANGVYVLAEDEEEQGEEEYSEEITEEYTEETWETEETDEYSGEYYEGDESGEEEPEDELDEEGNPKPYTDTSKPPSLNAKSAAIYCRNTGEIIYARNSDKRVCPYSVTKLLTALIAVQRLPLNQKVVISQEAAWQEGSTMELYEGEEVTVEDLLYGTLILSGNDAAYALGEAVSGDMDSFINLMNDTASNMGCKNTHFSNCTGLSGDVDEHYTTAKDMMSICKVAFANETVSKIAGTLKYEMPQTNFTDTRVMESHNKLLVDKVDGFVAGKTGWYGENYASLAMSYEKDGLDLIVVLFDANEDARWTDCENLVKYATANIQGVTVFPKGEIIGKVRVRHGAETRVDAVTETECVTYIPKTASEQLIKCDAIMFDDVTAPIREGDIVGRYQVYVANELVDEVNLVAIKGIKEGWFPSYVGISNQASLIGGGVLLLLIIALITRIAVGVRNRRIRKQAHRERVRELARKQMESEKEEFDSHRGKFYR